MQDSEHDPGEPWPQDMTIRVEHSPRVLAYLLFVRRAWDLPVSNVADTTGILDLGASRRPDGLDVAAATGRWRIEWHRAWEPFGPRVHAIRRPDPEIQRLLDTLSDAELWDAVSVDTSPFWTDGIDQAAFERWHAEDTHHPEVLPEHACIDALVPAWQNGLTTVVQMPYKGLFAERINPEHLVVSEETRSTPMHYRRALAL